MTTDQSACAPLPTTWPIVAACLRATAHNFGRTVLGDPVVTPAGVRVRMSSWPRQQEALRTLRAVGYAVVEDNDPAEHGEAVLVTGWDFELLADRGRRLATANRQLRRDQATYVDEALARFRILVDEDGLGDDVATARVDDEIRAGIEQLPGPPRHANLFTVAESDRASAPHEIRDVLDQVVAEQRMLAGLDAATRRLAAHVIDLFREYRDIHDYDDESAASQAARDVHASLAASPQGEQGDAV